MARGQIAKAEVENKIRQAFGSDFLGVDSSTKKIYVQAEEDGEKINIAITMTCPKNPFVVDGAASIDTFSTGDFREPTNYEPAEITDTELDNVRKLIRELGL